MNIIINRYVFNGNHETTHTILNFMSETDFADKEVIDIGCGSGILSIRASELGAKHIVALDNDSRAVNNTKENAERNGITNIKAIWLDFMESDLNADIILANLPRETAQFCMLKIKRSLNSGGTLITSWFNELPKDYLLADMTIINRYNGIYYDTYVLKKKGTIT